jgi:outer membrane protein, heavy metal efflux system
MIRDWKRWSASAGAGMLLLCGAPGLRGQAAEELTLQRALELAEQHSPALRAAAAQARGAEAGIRTAKSYPNPEFNTYFGRQYIRQAGAVPGLMEHYSAAQPVELPSVRRARIRAAELGRDSSAYGQAEARLALRAGVKQAFYAVLRRRAEIELAQENLRLVQELRNRVEVQVDVGEAARLELTRADAEIATARTLANSARLRYRNAVAALRTAVGAPLPAQLEARGEPERGRKLPPLESLTAELLAQHPAVAQADAQVRRAEAALAHEREQRKPTPWLRGEYERQPDLGFFRFGLTLPLPLWNKREGPIAEAEADASRRRAEAEMRRIELKAAMESAYGLYEVAGEQVASFEQGVLKEAEEALKAAEAAFRYGERGIIEVLDAQRVLRTVRHDFLSAQYDLQAALIEVELLRGTSAEEKK